MLRIHFSRESEVNLLEDIYLELKDHVMSLRVQALFLYLEGQYSFTTAQDHFWIVDEQGSAETISTCLIFKGKVNCSPHYSPQWTINCVI